MKVKLSIDEVVRSHVKQKVELTELLLETACSCACAGVPMSEIFVQVWDEWESYSMTSHGHVGFGSQVPVVGHASVVYRLC